MKTEKALDSYIKVEAVKFRLAGSSPDASLV